MSRNKIEPIVVHTVGVSNVVKDTYMGVLINGQTYVLPGVDTLDQVRNMIKNKEIEKFLKGVFNG